MQPIYFREKVLPQVSQFPEVSIFTGCVVLKLSVPERAPGASSFTFSRFHILSCQRSRPQWPSGSSFRYHPRLHAGLRNIVPPSRLPVFATLYTLKYGCPTKFLFVFPHKHSDLLSLFAFPGKTDTERSTNVAEMAIGCGHEAERDSVLAFLAADS